MARNNLVENVERDAKKYFVDARPTHDWSHVERVIELSERIGKEEGADMLVVRLAVLLHDTGRKLEEDTKGQVCHAEVGERIAREILRNYSVENDVLVEKVEKVCHCVRTHRWRNECVPETIEAKVVYDADKLDVLGAIGVARAYSFTGENGQKLYSNFKETEIETGYESNWSPVKEFYSKLSKIKDKLLTKAGKKIANSRHKFMVEFFSELEREIKGEV